MSTHKLNLPELSKKTESQLGQASSKEHAISVLKSFVEEFKDGHFKVVLVETAASSKVSEIVIDKNTSGSDACKAFESAPKGFHFAFLPHKEMGFGETHLQGRAFLYTTLKAGGKKIGFIKIPSFVSQHYPEVCEAEWESYRKSLSGSCDNDCKDKFIYEILPNHLLKQIEFAVISLKKEKISSLVVDIANNGGGNDWVSAATRIFTKKPILCGQFGYIRHSHWTKRFQEDIKELNEKLSKTSENTEKENLQKALTQAQLDLEESKKTCDRSRIWKDKNYKNQCDIVVKKQKEECDVHPEFQFKPGLYDGPLYVLINNNTASAAEDMVGRLKESGAATIVGAKTHGSGCGYTNGGIDLKLKHLGLKVVIPDCARYLRTGVNEVEGIMPDIEIPQAPSGALGFTIKLREILEK